MFGSGIFGDIIFADIFGLGGGGGGGAGLIGGSGFPADWFERMHIARSQGVLDDKEIEEIVALGLLD